MARHILHGEFTTFFWGQAYGGSQEALLTAPVFWIFGIGWLALRIVPICLSAVAALVVWRVGLRTDERAGGPDRGGAVLDLAAVPDLQAHAPVGLLRERRPLLRAAPPLLGLRVVERPTTGRSALFGLVLGLAVWETEQVVPVALPLLAWMTWKQRAWLGKLWIAIPAALARARSRRSSGTSATTSASFHSTVPDTTTYQHRLRLFVSPLLPLLLGLREDYTQKKIIPSAIARSRSYAALAALFAWGAWRSRRRPISLLYLVAAVYPFFYAIPAETLLRAQTRSTSSCWPRCSCS